MKKQASLHIFTALCLLAPTQSLVVPPDRSLPDTCNTCCHGPAGLPGVPGAAGAAGIPGSPGHNALPGRDGMKGEVGRKGEMGERGESGDGGLPGPQGPSGDRGERGTPGLQGGPGKVGPQGLQGMHGLKGEHSRGGKGQKGETGIDSNGQRSAFSVAKTSSQTGSVNDVLTFDTAETNIGEHFSLQSSMFTCQIPGTYVFMFTISTASYTHEPYVDLVKDGAKIARVLLRKNDSGGLFLQGSQGVVVQLSVGNQVWLIFGSNAEQVYSDASKYTTFSGFLLYED